MQDSGDSYQKSFDLTSRAAALCYHPLGVCSSQHRGAEPWHTWHRAGLAQPGQGAAARRSCWRAATSRGIHKGLLEAYFQGN